jgi:fibronectin-binding autotransporter adhesin
LTLGADRSIGRITFGGGSTTISLSGSTLRLNSTTTSAGTGTALWNASTADGKAATVDSSILLQAGASGTYTGHFRENNNSNGGTTFNGQITQGVGENWTMRFSRNSARGTFRLNNAANNFSGVINAGADVLSLTPGSYGSGLITLSGGATGTATNEHYTTAVGNDVTVTAASGWSSNVATRLTGNLSQGGNVLTYAATGSGFTRADFASVSGSGATTTRSGALWATSMSSLTTGTLNIADGTAGFGTFILSGTGSSDAPTWDDFTGARTYNQSGGAGTWRINTTTTAGTAGGFAARNGDVTIPHQSAPNAGGITDTTFARNFVLGSQAVLNGSRIADSAVKVNTDIAFGSAEYRPAITWNTQTVAGNSSTSWTLGGPVHELNGVLSGANVELVPLSAGSSTNRGIVRITNGANNLTGASVWVLGSTRSSWTTPGGIAITSSNPDDQSGVVAVFTSDAAFGGSSVEVVVSALGSSGTATNSLLMFEDANISGTTTFDKGFSLLGNTGTYAAGFGNWAGDSIYTGDISMPATFGTNGNAVVHVRDGSLTLGTSGDAAGITNNRSAATTFHKEGDGTLVIDNLVVSGSQSSNSWNVRGGTMLVNDNMAAGNIAVINGSALGGDGTISGNVTFGTGGGVLSPGNSPGTLDVSGNLTLNAATTAEIELGGAAPGDGSGFYDQINATGTAALASAVLNVSTFGGFNPNGGVYYILSRSGGTGTFFGLAEGDTVLIDGGLGSAQITYLADWTGSHGSSSLTGGDDIALYNVAYIPEPTTLSLLAVGAVGLTRRRRA